MAVAPSATSRPGVDLPSSQLMCEVRAARNALLGPRSLQGFLQRFLQHQHVRDSADGAGWQGQVAWSTRIIALPHDIKNTSDFTPLEQAPEILMSLGLMHETLNPKPNAHKGHYLTSCLRVPP